MRLGCVGKVVRGQHWVIHKATEWVKQRRKLIVRIVGKRRVFNALWWVILARVKCRPALAHFFRAEYFVGNTELIPEFTLPNAVVALGKKYQVTSLHELGHAVWVLDTNKIVPVVPILR